jgi:hypothetical protein
LVLICFNETSLRAFICCLKFPVPTVSVVSAASEVNLS